MPPFFLLRTEAFDLVKSKLSSDDFYRTVYYHVFYGLGYTAPYLSQLLPFRLAVDSMLASRWRKDSVSFLPKITIESL